jgi:hypothetical protein
MDLIEKTLHAIAAPPGEKLYAEDKSELLYKLNLKKGQRPKKVIDSARQPKGYYVLEEVQTPLLYHYENHVDWYQRDDRFDFNH